MDQVVGKGDAVRVHYEASLDDGSVVDSTKGKSPLELRVGEGKFVEGFESALIGLRTGERKRFMLSAKDAFGEKDDDLVDVVPKEAFRNVFEPKVGMRLGLRAPDGTEVPVKVIAVDDAVTIDKNHPLAGERVHFDVTVVSIR
ncbi:MAG: peptidylprolyl isomerase [Nanoarchaeota archaeon]